MATVELPPFSQQQKEISDRFVARVQADIQRDGAIAFSEYMHRSLYENELGYYVNGFSKLGKHGDFTTAPEISDDFAWCLAQQCQQALLEIDTGDILEFGGGSGKLALDLLNNLARLDCLPQRYLILDVSAELQQEQKQLLEKELPANVFCRVSWLSALPENFTGVVVANEVLDAFAVERFTISDGMVQRLMVDCSQDKFFLLHAISESVTREVESIQQDAGCTFNEGYTSEYCALLTPWWQSLTACLDKGVVIVCDYGADRRQYYSDKKSSGTLRCFYQHTLHDDPFARPAVQDITADVDFTAVAAAATSAGLELQGYTPLSEFMLSLDVLTHHEQKTASLDTRDQIMATGDLKRILLPQEMGDRFMVIGFSKNVDTILSGFSRADWSRLL